MECACLNDCNCGNKQVLLPPRAAESLMTAKGCREVPKRLQMAVVTASYKTGRRDSGAPCPLSSRQTARVAASHSPSPTLSCATAIHISTDMTICLSLSRRCDVGSLSAVATKRAAHYECCWCH